MTSPSDTPRRRASARLLPGILRRPAAAAYCSVSVATWDRMAAAGQTPEPVRLGGAVGWNRRELAAWIDAGCPTRSSWTPVWRAAVAARRRASV